LGSGATALQMRPAGHEASDPDSLAYVYPDLPNSGTKLRFLR
jgi:hypothetical protein